MARSPLTPAGPRTIPRRLDREAQRNVELVWLTGRLMPDLKTITGFRKDNGKAIRKACRRFVGLGRRAGLFSEAVVAIDGSKFKAVNNRDQNFTPHKLKARVEQLEQSIARNLTELDRADREPASVPRARVARLKEKIAAVKEHTGKGAVNLSDSCASDGVPGPRRFALPIAAAS